MSRVDQHIAVHRFIAHRQRVLDMKPTVDSRRSKSVPPKGARGGQEGAEGGRRQQSTTTLQPKPRKTPQQKERERKIQRDNQRLLDKLIKISNRKPQL